MAHLRLALVLLLSLASLTTEARAADDDQQESWQQLVDYSANSAIIWTKSRADLDSLRSELISANVPISEIARKDEEKADEMSVINTLTMERPPEDAARLLKAPNFARYVEAITDNPIVHSFVGNCDDEDLIPAVSTAQEVVPTGVRRVYGGDPPAYTGGKRAWIIDSGISGMAASPNIESDLAVNRGMSRECRLKSGCGADTGTDNLGHGTMIAGIIGAKAANDIGLRGVAPGASLVSVRIFQRNIPKTTASVALEALKYVEPNLLEDDVINISWGMYFNPTMEDGAPSAELLLEAKLRDLAKSKKVWIVVAAGNIDSGESTGYVQTISPARAGGYRTDDASGKGAVMTISAVESRYIQGVWYDNFWPASAFGNGRVPDPGTDYQPGPPDYAAPGVNIPSYWPGDKVNTCSGTSFAAAHVSGLMLYSAIPAMNGAARARWDPSAIKPRKTFPGSTSDYYVRNSDPIALK